MYRNYYFNTARKPCKGRGDWLFGQHLDQGGISALQGTYAWLGREYVGSATVRLSVAQHDSQIQRGLAAKEAVECKSKPILEEKTRNILFPMSSPPGRSQPM